MNFVFKIVYPFKTFGFLNVSIKNIPLTIEHVFGNVSFILLLIAVILYWFDFYDTKPVSKKLKSFCMIGANLSLTFLLLVRWYQSGHFPLSNLYESLIGLSWSLTTVHLIVTLNIIKVFSGQFNKESDKVGAIIAPTALLTSVFATFFLPPEMLRATALIPALKSNWLTMHVTVMVASYAFLLIGSLLSITFCVYRLSIKVNVNSSLSNFWPSLKKFDDIKSKESYNFNTKFHQISNKAVSIWTGLSDHEPKGMDYVTSGNRPSADVCGLAQRANAFGQTPGVRAQRANAFGLAQRAMASGSVVSGSFYGPTTYKPTTGESTTKKSTPKTIINPQFYSQTNQSSITMDLSNKSINEYDHNLYNYKELAKNDYYLALNERTQRTIDEDQVQLNICIWLNTMSYRILGLGFPLLTIGILSGAVWANEAWGSYWSWDPKETWALITWLVFAIYFHSRYKRSSDLSLIPATIASIGFIVIWICYLGVNLLQTGLHSYGWFGTLLF